MPPPGVTRAEWRRQRQERLGTAVNMESQQRAPRQGAPRTRAARRAPINDNEAEEEEPQVPQEDANQLGVQIMHELDELDELDAVEERLGRPNVMLPKVATLPPIHDVPEVRSSSQRRNPQRQADEKPSIYAHHLKNGRRFMQKFKLPFTWAQLVSDANNTNKLTELQPEIDKMEDENYAIQAGSALFYTSDEVLVFVYLGCRTSDMVTVNKDGGEYMDLLECEMTERLQSTLEHKEKEAQIIKEQHILEKAKRRKHGQHALKDMPSMKSLLFFNDGFSKSMMDRLYFSAHFMAAYNIPKGDTSRKRHGIDHGHMYHYFDLEEGVKFTDEVKLSRQMVLSEDGGKTGLQPVGVHHMVEGWPQKQHPKKDLYLASALSGTGQSTLATRYFYQANEVLEKMVAVAVKEFFPKIHEVGSHVREAGRAIPTSDGKPCGMYLARAVIFKLQVLPHKDNNDFGVSTSFPCGYYKGGYLIVPQLKSKFRYAPGDLAIFYANLIFHRVAEWKAPPMKKDDVIAPGRVGMVMFNPSASVAELRDKEVKYSERTMYGKLPTIGPGRKEMEGPQKKKQRIVT